MALITQSITVNGDTWNVTFDQTEADARGANCATNFYIDLRYFSSTHGPQCEGARRLAIAKHLGGPLPTGVS